MMELTRPNACQVRHLLTVVRLGWGVLLLVAPGEAIRVLGGENTGRGRVVARILGGRHVVQAVWERRGSPGREGAGALVDALHAATGVGIAGLDARARRAALTDAALATGFSVGGAWLWHALRQQQNPGTQDTSVEI